MQLEQRAFYNLLRMNWRQNSDMDVEEWQIADYREMPMEEILDRLEKKEIFIDPDTFHVFAENFDTPESLTESVLQDRQSDQAEKDEIYLLLFEIWRRQLPEKPCLSIFCDEMDHVILSYYEGTAKVEQIEDILSNLQVILDENVDAGMKTTEVFETVTAGNAHDVESFLYDYISDQMDLGNFSYAKELYEGFEQYMGNSKWFKLLECRLLSHFESDEAPSQIQKLMRQAIKEKDLEFDLDILSFLILGGEKSDFRKLAKSALDLLVTEEDFQELLGICEDFFDVLDEDEKEDRIQELLDHRDSIPLESKISSDDPDLRTLRSALG